MLCETKLESALRHYVANEWQVDTAIAGVALATGHTSSTQDNAERIVFDAGDRGGPLVDQGNYEVPVEIVVITNGIPAEGEMPEVPLQRHAQRVEELAAIFTARPISITVEGSPVTHSMGSVVTALEALDAELGVSGYWPLPHQSGRKDGNFTTSLPFVFHVHLKDAE